MPQKRFLVLAALGLLVMVGWSAGLGQAGSGVKINLKLDAPTVLLGETFEADLDALDVPSPGAGSWIVDVVFDPDRVTVVGCDTEESFSCGTFAPNVRLQRAVGGSLIGDVDLGTITFRGDAEGVMPLAVEVFGFNDADLNDLTVGMTINETSVTITNDGVPPVPTATSDAPTQTPTVTPTGDAATPSATSTPGETGDITVFVRDDSRDPPEGIPDWPVNVFEGEGCQGQPIASNATGDSGGVGFFGLPVGSYSVSRKPQDGWEGATPFCQNAMVEAASKTLVLFFKTPIRDGDLNKDGVTNSLDALLTLQFVAGLIGELPNAHRADVNQDGAVNAVDAQLILQFDGGLIESLPVGD